MQTVLKSENELPVHYSRNNIRGNSPMDIPTCEIILHAKDVLDSSDTCQTEAMTITTDVKQDAIVNYHSRSTRIKTWNL